MRIKRREVDLGGLWNCGAVWTIRKDPTLRNVPERAGVNTIRVVHMSVVVCRTIFYRPRQNISRFRPLESERAAK